jgi:hypothetical protein
MRISIGFLGRNPSIPVGQVLPVRPGAFVCHESEVEDGLAALRLDPCVIL